MPEHDRNEREPDDALAEVTREYRASLPGTCEAIRAAVAAGDLAALRQIAHQTRGAAGMFGYHGLTETAGLLEDAIVEGQDHELILELADEFLSGIQASRFE
jgi:HPt (histidine-containing phosphotransfer) domain-containing protein